MSIQSSKSITWDKNHPQDINETQTLLSHESSQGNKKTKSSFRLKIDKLASLPFHLVNS
jgi:hypothetical protein